MKKLILGLIPLALMLSCEKNEVAETKQNVTIGYRLIEENSMTRAMANEDILNDISQCLPSQVDLILRNSVGTQSVVKSGTEVSLELGAYSITGSSYGTQVGDKVNNNSYFTSSPYITISGNIDVVKGTNKYYVNGTFKSMAFCVDYGETASAEYKNNAGEWKTLQLITYDNIGLIFFQGNLTDVPLYIRLTDKNNNETIYTFTTSQTNNNIFVENSKFYKLHPQGAETLPQIEISYLPFAEGEL